MFQSSSLQMNPPQGFTPTTSEPTSSSLFQNPSLQTNQPQGFIPSTSESTSSSLFQNPSLQTNQPQGFAQPTGGSTSSSLFQSSSPQLTSQPQEFTSVSVSSNPFANLAGQQKEAQLQGFTPAKETQSQSNDQGLTSKLSESASINPFANLPGQASLQPGLT